MSYWSALWFAVVQGITELFPVSSVAHAVLIPSVFRLNIHEEGLLPFMVMLHLGTALALLLFYRKEWFAFARGLLAREDALARRVFVRIVVGTLPAALIGFVFLKALRAHFPSGTSAALFLMVNGLILLIADRRRKRIIDRFGIREGADADHEIGRLTLGQSALIGLAQSLALIPGFSRSGMTMVAGLYAGLSYGAAARFAFLLATPIILGAGIVEMPQLFKPEFAGLLGPAVVGGIAAGAAAYGSVWVLVRYFHRHEVQAFRPFALYCLIVGGLSLLILL